MAQGAGMKKRLSIAGQSPIETGRAKAALRVVTPSILQRQIVGMFHELTPLASCGRLRSQPVIKGKSPVFGMGMEIGVDRRPPAIHIDEDLLNEVLADKRVATIHHQVARYFILTAAVHTFTREMPFIKRHQDEGPLSMMNKAWKWAAGMALKDMNLNPEIQANMVDSCRDVTREKEKALAEDSLFFTGQAVQYNVTPPALSPVEPWAIGLAFPYNFAQIEDAKHS